MGRHPVSVWRLRLPLLGWDGRLLRLHVGRLAWVGLGVGVGLWRLWAGLEVGARLRWGLGVVIGHGNLLQGTYRTPKRLGGVAEISGDAPSFLV